MKSSRIKTQPKSDINLKPNNMNTNAFTHKLRLLNDDVNHIQVVPIYISEVMNITDDLAELLTYQVHYEGSTILKYGSLEDLSFFCEMLNMKGLIAEIELIEPITPEP